MVGVVQGNRMSIRPTRRDDNAPVTDAVITVRLRGAVHPTVAEADGSYSFQSADLTLPGAARIEFDLRRGADSQHLQGDLVVPGTEQSTEGASNARQLWWWALNFAVCIGFLMLWSRRRKAAEDSAGE